MSDDDDPDGAYMGQTGHDNAKSFVRCNECRSADVGVVDAFAITLLTYGSKFNIDTPTCLAVYSAYTIVL